jgi:hypothetical protein
MTQHDHVAWQLSLFLITALSMSQFLFCKASAVTESLAFNPLDIRAEDTTGKLIEGDVRLGDQIMLTLDSRNMGDSVDSYVALIQVSTEDSQVVFLKWETGTASVNGSINSGFAWQAKEVGTYTVKSFLWTSLERPMPLSDPSQIELTVGRSDDGDDDDDTPYVTTTTITLDLGETNPTGTFKLTGVSPDSVTGLQYYDYPVGGGPGIAVDMTIGQQVTNGCTVTVKLVSLNHASQQATFEQTVDSDPNRMCPICWWQLDVIDTSTATSR